MSGEMVHDAGFAKGLFSGLGKLSCPLDDLLSDGSLDVSSTSSSEDEDDGLAKFESRDASSKTADAKYDTNTKPTSAGTPSAPKDGAGSAKGSPKGKKKSGKKMGKIVVPWESEVRDVKEYVGGLGESFTVYDLLSTKMLVWTFEKGPCSVRTVS